ncbi:MBL fold metallo-hydrolase [Propionicimonas sp.]|uniref:MBL fold metallo-hydrolase n=1 Tax=Propionicimonas sp. TaxID=1955623 RepID=UPI0039E58835
MGLGRSVVEKVELPGLVLRRAAVGGMDNNVYLFTSVGGAQLLVDAAAEPDTIEALLDAASADAAEPHLQYLLTTHSHHDHIGALAAVASAHPEAAVLAGDADADAITAATGVPVTRRLRDGDVLALGDLEVAVIGLRGHTPGSVALGLAPAGAPAQLVTGDSLFPGGVGNTGRDAGRFARLFADVVARVFARYPDETVVWPGHGLPTTLGAERPHLAEWEARGW